MNKKFLSAILFGALMVSSTGTFVSCKDYDDDIDNINKELTEIKSQIAAMQTKIDAGKWITSVSSVTGGFTVAFSDGSSYTITNGKDGAAGEAGAAGTQWTISEDGYWECDGVKTEVKALGEKGEAGQDAQPEVKKENGKWYLWNAETGAFEEISVDAPATANIPYYYTDPNDPNYTYLVVYDENGENELRLPMTSGLGQVVVLDGEDLSIVYNTFNGAHFKDGKATDWTGGKKALPKKGEYMLTASAKAIYVQVVPANYDISKLSFKLVNTKGDEAPITLGTPEVCNEAISRAVSESGVYAIPFTLPEMTDAVIKDYTNNIAGKALSLVATESVRSTYTNTLSVYQASNNVFGGCYGTQKADKQPYTVSLDYNSSNVYDSFLTMASDAAKADSVKYGIKIDGMTISYNENMPENKAISFTINQINSRAVVNSENKVSVTFNPTEAVAVKTIALDAVAPHTPVALLKNTAGDVTNETAQSIVVDFEPYFKVVTPEDGDRLIWNQNNTQLYVANVMWTHVVPGGAVVEEQVTDLVKDLVLLDKAGADKKGGSVALKDFSKLRIQFTDNYGAQDIFNNGTLIATINVYGENAEGVTTVLQKVEIPFSFNAVAATEIASWFNWNAKNSYTADGLVCYVGTPTAASPYEIKLNDYFAANTSLTTSATLAAYINKHDTKDEWTPNMTIGYPSDVFKGLTTDAAKNTAKDVATWKDFTNPCWTIEPTNPTAYETAPTIVLKDLTDAYFGTYTISGIKVSAMNRTISAANLKIVVKGEASRADVISYSKSPLQIASKQNEYIKLSDSAFAPNAGSFFGTFTLKDYMGRNYVLGSATTIKVVEVATDGSYDKDFATASLSEVISAEAVKYTYTKGSSATNEAYGIQFNYLEDVEYPAGKTFKVMLQISGGLTKDGASHSEAVVVPATITIGGI